MIFLCEEKIMFRVIKIFRFLCFSEVFGEFYAVAKKKKKKKKNG